jgi:carbon starvation protein CstA
MVVLWTITVYLAQERKQYWVTLVPAVFMTAVTSTYLLFAPEGFSLSMGVSYSIGIVISIVSLAAFFAYQRSYRL